MSKQKQIESSPIYMLGNVDPYALKLLVEERDQLRAENEQVKGEMADQGPYINKLRTKLSEQAAEIATLRAAAEQAWEALEYAGVVVMMYPEGEFHTATLRAALKGTV